MANFIEHNYRDGESFVSWFVNIGLQAKLGSLIYALLYVVIIWIPTYYLYKKKIFIKL